MEPVLRSNTVSQAAVSWRRAVRFIQRGHAAWRAKLAGLVNVRELAAPWPMTLSHIAHRISVTSRLTNALRLRAPSKIKMAAALLEPPAVIAA